MAQAGSPTHDKPQPPQYPAAPTGAPRAAAGTAPGAPAVTVYRRPSFMARLSQVAVSFLIVFGSYLAYAVAVVPLIEPPAYENPTASAKTPLPPTVNPREEMLAPYFPPGSWELNRPKLLESDRAMLLIKEYQNLPDGRVKLHPCTVIFLGEESARGEGKSPPVILQAPEGAILRFDEPFDLKRAKVGRLIGGSLVGKVTIRREPSQPGAADDLRITTRDVELTEDRVVTPHPVDFHFGPSYGTGREMTVMLARTDRSAETAGGEKKGLGITGVNSFQLAREVRMHMRLGGKDPQDLVVGERDDKLPRPKPEPRRNQEPPVEITCQGPFHFDLAKYVATFSEHVDVLRLNSNGPSDQMNCELLLVYFSRRDQPDAKAKGQRLPGRSKSGGPPSLEARMVEARGDPVVVRSPSTGGQARCERLEYDLKTNRIALNGVGKLEGAAPKNPGQKYFARWSKQLLVEPQGTPAQPAGQLISLVGAAHVQLTDVGSRGPNGAPQPAAITAEEIHAWLDPPPAERSTPAASPLNVGGSDEIRPRRVLAQGAVQMNSATLVGSAGRMEISFVNHPPAPGAQPGAAEPAPGRRQSNANAPDQRQFFVECANMVVQAAIREGRYQLAELLLEGSPQREAKLGEIRTAKPTDKPLLVRGDRVQLSGGDGPDSQVLVSGKPASVEARGLSLTGNQIQLEQRTNLLWIEGAGRMGLPMNRDLEGHALPEGQKLDITWEGRMKFDGLSAVFERSVVGRTGSQLLRTEVLEATLKRRIEFANPPAENKSSEAAQLDQVVCRGGAFLENRSSDEKGLSSIDRLQALDMQFNHTTGGIDARGPGWVSSVRRGMPTPTAGGLPGGPKPPAAAKPAAAAPDDADRLSYLQVQFQRRINGNMHTRELVFSDQVKTVYGPVATWEQTLDADNPDGLGPEGVSMTCDQLTVRQTAEQGPEGRGYMELEGLGNTLVEGHDFTARAHRLTFAEKKSLLVLEGDGRADAQLFRQPTPGAATSQASARRILYWQATNRVEVDDVRFFDFGALNLSPSKPKPPANNTTPPPANK